MHGLAESKWSKQRSGPQFFSTKVEPPTPPAETVFDNAPASAQEAFSSSRATLREAEESHPSPTLATSAGPPGSQPYPRPESSSDQGGANTAFTRGSIARPKQDSIGASRPPPSPSTAPRAPPKANGGNPWAAFALAADPEGQAQDGRSYVGGRSYIVDKPAATSTARTHPPKSFPPPQSKTPKPQNNTAKPFSQPQSNISQRPGPTSAGTGWNSSSSTPASQKSWPQSPQSQNSTNQRPGLTSAASGWNSTSSPSANQQSWPQPPRSATRPPAENRWAGRPLATTAMFTDDFFSTAKPRTQTPSTAPSSSAMDRQNQVQSQNSHGWTDQGYTNNNSTQNQDFSNNAQSRPGSSVGSKPSSWRDYKQQQDRQQQDSQQQTYEQQQQQQQQEQEQEQERGQEQEQEQGQRQRQQGQQLQQSHRQPQQPVQPPAPQPYQQQIRSGPINGLKKEPLNAWPAEDEGNTTFHRTSVPNNESGRTSRMDAVSDIPDDPLFLQYPIGDGCHVVVAMYVERSAEAAAGRFPTMTRKRQESSWKQKSVDEVTAIFKQALIEEKKDITG